MHRLTPILILISASACSDPGNALAVDADITTQLHQLSVFEWYVIEADQGLIRVGGETPFDVGPGDTVAIPKHVSQQITNTGPEDLCFLCVYTPKFSQECYTSLE
jgi:mannose-6-phosphate isomerase-like protein (cupin superfamily)